MKPATRHPLQDDAAILLRLSRSMMDESSPSSNVSDYGGGGDDEGDDFNDREGTVRPSGRDDGAETASVWNASSPSSSSRRQSAPTWAPLPTSLSTGRGRLDSLRKAVVAPMPDAQDRKRFIGCLAAVLASAYDYQQYEKDGTGGEGTRLDEYPAGKRDVLQASVNDGRAFVIDDNEYDNADENGNREDFDNDGTRFGTPGRIRSTTGLHRFAGGSGREPASGSSFDDSLHGSRNGARRSAACAARHRKRRHEVLSKLLLSAAELLNIEKGQAKAFLPMLSKLVVPDTAVGSRSATATRRPVAGSSSSSRGEPEGTRRPRTAPLDAESTFEYNNSRSFDYSDDKSNAVSASAAASDELEEQLDRIEHLRPFLESMTPGSGFRCLSLFLLQHLMNSPDGYDARVRHPLKVLAVLLLCRDMEHDPVDVLADDPDLGKGGMDFDIPANGPAPTSRRRDREARDRATIATRKFEALEQYIATKLLHLSQHQLRQPHSHASSSQELIRHSSSGFSRDSILRGLKIGGAAVVAGTLFAVTGGLAAPGIAAGVAAIAGGTAAAAAATAVLTSTAAVTAIFGVGGGSLAAYKMQRRTQGLTEFQFRKESTESSADLFMTVAISGWLRDKCDFQRPWGVSPTDPPIRDRLELLERFYFIHSPDHVLKCKKILQSWEGEESRLWKLLAQKYGRDPSHLFPLDGDCNVFRLTLEQKEVVDNIFVELGYVASTSKPASTAHHRQASPPLDRVRKCLKHRLLDQSTPSANSLRCPELQNAQLGTDSLHGPNATTLASISSLDSWSESDATYCSREPMSPKDSKDSGPSIPKHLCTVWDYESNYGGEFYTVKWEGDLMIELCDSVADLAFELVSGGTAQILKHTALSTIMSAIAWPYALVNAANMIDGTWTLAVERSDEAGRELARSLLFSRAGRRPVTLIGFSFGARAIYACLKELAHHQEIWEKNGADDADNRCDDSNGSNLDSRMREPASVVEDVILMGLPNHLSLDSWSACRRIVAGRFVNCFSQKDLILSLMFQFKRLGLKPVCGTCPVKVSGVENVDVSDLVSAHQDYCLVAGTILRRVRHGQPFTSQSLNSSK